MSKNTPNGPDPNTKNGKLQPNILLIGDSNNKDINPHKLPKSSVRNLTYPGERAEEISNQVSLVHINFPPTDVIIHAGTNNLKTNSSKECFDNIQLKTNEIKWHV